MTEMKKRFYMGDDESQGGKGFSVIADFEGNEEQIMDVDIDNVLPVLPLRNMVLFPGVLMPVSVGRKSSLRLIRDAEKKGLYIGVVCQKVADTENPLMDDLHDIGTVAKVIRVLEMPDQSTTVILQGTKRMQLKEIVETTPYLQGHVTTINEELPEKNDKEFQALVEACKDLIVRYMRTSEMFSQDPSFAIKNISNPIFLINFICTNLQLKKDEKIELLRMNSLRERAYHLLEILNREVQLAEIKASIQMRAREDIDQQQREYFLQQQIKTIQDELGGSTQEQEIAEMRKKAETVKWSDEVKATFLKEVDKLERTHPQSPDYSVQLNYLQTMLSLPWGIYTTDNLNHPGAPGRAEAEGRHEVAHHLPLWPSGRGKDVAGTLDSRRAEAQVRAHVAGRRARRGGDTRTPSHVHRRHAGTHHQEPDQGGIVEPCLHPRRDRQGERRPSGRPVVGPARGARP